MKGALMAPETRKIQRVKWWGIMIALFTVSVWVVSKNNSEVTFQDATLPSESVDQSSLERIEREKLIEQKIEQLDESLEKLKGDLRKSPILSSKRKKMRDLQRELHSERRIIRQELQDLRRASPENWEHFADHLEAELQKADDLVKEHWGE